MGVKTWICGNEKVEKMEKNTKESQKNRLLPRKEMKRNIPQEKTQRGEKRGHPDVELQ